VAKDRSFLAPSGNFSLNFPAIAVARRKSHIKMMKAIPHRRGFSMVFLLEAGKRLGDLKGR
jgi:hypothetical protein